MASVTGKNKKEAITNSKEVALAEGGQKEKKDTWKVVKEVPKALSKLSNYHFIGNAFTVVLPLSLYTYTMMELNIKILFRSEKNSEKYIAQEQNLTAEGLALNARYIVGEDTSMFVILLMDYFSCISALLFVFLIMIFVDFGKETRTDRMSEFKSIFKGS
jgi:hypothetical protein